MRLETASSVRPLTDNLSHTPSCVCRCRTAHGIPCIACPHASPYALLVQVINKRTELHHNDRVWLGNNYAFRFVFPGQVRPGLVFRGTGFCPASLLTAVIHPPTAVGCRNSPAVASHPLLVTRQIPSVAYQLPSSRLQLPSGHCRLPSTCPTASPSVAALGLKRQETRLERVGE